MSLFSLPKNFSLSKSIGVVWLWWRQWSSWAFLLFFLIVAGLGVFSWYQSLYAFHWSADKEQAYRLSKNKQVKFQQDRFDSALSMIETRAVEHEKAPEAFRDVFFGP